MDLQIILERLHCAGTTEAGHDEVYFVLSGVAPDGTPISGRGPDRTMGGSADNGTAWDMNDSGRQQDQAFNAILHQSRLSPGQSTSLMFSFNESDGTNIAATLAAAAKVAANFANTPLVTAISQGADLLSSLIPGNQDDFLGTIGLRIVATEAGLVADQFLPGPTTTIVSSLNPSDGRFALRFRNDDGDYTAYFRINGLAAPATHPTHPIPVRQPFPRGKTLVDR